MNASDQQLPVPRLDIVASPAGFTVWVWKIKKGLAAMQAHDRTLDALIRRLRRTQLPVTVEHASLATLLESQGITAILAPTPAEE